MEVVWCVVAMVSTPSPIPSPPNPNKDFLQASAHLRHLMFEERGPSIHDLSGLWNIVHQHLTVGNVWNQHLSMVLFSLHDENKVRCERQHDSLCVRRGGGGRGTLGCYVPGWWEEEDEGLGGGEGEEGVRYANGDDDIKPLGNAP